MRINQDNFQEIVKYYRSSLLNQRIVDITLINSRLFLFTLKKAKQKLVIDLDNVQPHLGMITTDYDELTLPSEFIAKALAKGTPLIKEIEIINNDKIVRIVTESTDAYYHRNQYYLYLELINAHANMILTDQNDKIIVAFYETSLDAPRPIVKNFKYAIPSKKNETIIKNDFTLSAYQEYVNNSFKEGVEKRKKELYGKQIKKYEKRLKNLEHKLGKIKNTTTLANDGLKYKEFGETILMNLNDIKKGDVYFNDIKLDVSKNPTENANYYFNKYKKAKRTIETTKNIIENINQEILDTKYYLDVFKMGNENDLKALLNVHESNKKQKDIPAYLPFVINYQNSNYYFGHNALSNDYLTFKMFKKSSLVTWLHLKNHPSVHLIINKEKPNNHELEIACSLLLLLNQTKAGEIMYAKRQDITRGEGLAKVNVLHYQSITMQKINPKAVELLTKRKRAHES